MNEDRTTAQKVIETWKVAALTVIAELVVGHPFDTVKTRMQASFVNTSATNVARSIWTTEGPAGIYRGASACLSRMALKAAYRYPARPMVKEQIGTLTTSEVPRNVLTGLTLAVMDGIILTPIERMKVWLIVTAPSAREPSCAVTSQQASPWGHLKSFTDFLRGAKSRGGLIAEIYRGVTPTTLRAVLSWTSYLVIEERIYNLFPLHCTAPDGQTDPQYAAHFILRSLSCGFLAGCVNILCVLPLDTVKTKMQQYTGAGPQASASPSLLRCIQGTYFHGGLRALYAGWQMRLPQYVLVGAVQSMTVPLIDRIWGLRGPGV
jgi:hypothetical protein